jgi:predicted TIM-barrel fold metal-dependent hydrolase
MVSVNTSDMEEWKTRYLHHVLNVAPNHAQDFGIDCGHRSIMQRMEQQGAQLNYIDTGQHPSATIQNKRGSHILCALQQKLQESRSDKRLHTMQKPLHNK